VVADLAQLAGAHPAPGPGLPPAAPLGEKLTVFTTGSVTKVDHWQEPPDVAVGEPSEAVRCRVSVTGVKMALILGPSRLS